MNKDIADTSDPIPDLDRLTPPHHFSKLLKKNAGPSLLLLGGLIIGWLLIEGVWFLFFRNDIRTLNMLVDTTYTYEVTQLYETDLPVITYSRDANGFRGTYNTMSDIDIIAIGGSTTDQRYLDDAQTWDHLLQEQLRQYNNSITVVNAGVDGHSTYGHLQSFDLWLNHLPDLTPKYIVYYVGLNDFYKDLGYGPDQLNNKTRKLFIWHLYRTMRGIVTVRAENLGHSSEDIESQPSTDQPLVAPEEYQNLMAGRLAEYGDRLRALSDQTHNLGAQPIFVTQRSLSYRTLNDQVTGLERTARYDDVLYNGVDRYYMEQLLNQETINVCEEVGGVCIDLAADIQFDYDDFYDDSHNTPPGAKIIADYLADKIHPLLP